MFAKGGGPGEVHSYFSPFESPVNAFVAANTSILDFENRVRTSILVANEPFLFCKGAGEENFTGIMTWSLKGFVNALQNVDTKVLEFHNKRGDFASWAENSLKDSPLKKKLDEIQTSKSRGMSLKEELVRVAKTRYSEVSEQARLSTKLF
jgi:alpha-amylase